MDFIMLLGLIAASCTTISFLPQAIKTIRTKHTESLSLVMYIILAIGLFSWLIYGILNKDIPLIIANSISFIFSSIILIMIIKYR